jgi:hypothetical protein
MEMQTDAVVDERSKEGPTAIVDDVEVVDTYY